MAGKNFRGKLMRFVFLFGCFFVLMYFGLPVVFAEEVQMTLSEEKADNGALLKLIDEKSTELKRIQEEREQLEKGLGEVQKVKSSLNRDVKTLDYNVRQLSLGIESNKVAAQKLELELDSLDQGMRQTERNVSTRKETIGKLLVEVHERDREPFFIMFLRNRSLADSVSEAQNLATLNNDLRVSIQELEGLQEDLSRKSVQTKLKKREHEIEKTTLANRQYILQDQKQEKQKLLQQTKSQEKIYGDGIAELEKQQEEISKVIEEVERKLRESFDPTLLPLKRSGVLGMPVQSPVVTQKYGKTKFAERAYKSKIHNGIDFAARIGTPILAAEDGIVKAVDNNDRGTVRWQKYQYGMYVLIEHSNNLSTLYAHLSRAIVRPGDSVKRGDVIGYSGHTGYSTGPHLHFTVYWSQGVQFKAIPPAAGLVPIGITVDPEEYL